MDKIELIKTKLEVVKELVELKILSDGRIGDIYINCNGIVYFNPEEYYTVTKIAKFLNEAYETSYTNQDINKFLIKYELQVEEPVGGFKKKKTYYLKQLGLENGGLQNLRLFIKNDGNIGQELKVFWKSDVLKFLAEKLNLGMEE